MIVWETLIRSSQTKISAYFHSTSCLRWEQTFLGLHHGEPLVNLLHGARASWQSHVLNSPLAPLYIKTVIFISFYLFIFYFIYLYLSLFYLSLFFFCKKIITTKSMKTRRKSRKYLKNPLKSFHNFKLSLCFIFL